jgi:phage/conjugal plasmid C-4 type zinc finger TraR family protein
MDESDVERGQMTESMLLHANLGKIQRSVAGDAYLDPNCEDCGFEIPSRRRAALPNARRCVDCQETHERGPR